MTIIVHESARSAIATMTDLDGIPSQTVERTIFDLCRRGPKTIDLAIDSALRRDVSPRSDARLVPTFGRRGRQALA